MRITDVPIETAGALRSAGSYFTDLVTPNIRLGVTGLSRAGKTVFITALVRNLILGGRLPFFAPSAEGRIIAAWLEPQPDDDVPRFSYEEHLAALAADPPRWPEGTRRVSQLRLTIEYRTTDRLRRVVGAVAGGLLVTRRLHVDIVDYPGEWLTDLGLLEETFEAWSSAAFGRLDKSKLPAAAPLRAFISGLGADAAYDEGVAQAGARLFTDWLSAQRASGAGGSTLTPGRFLMPGDLADSPLLTFFPLPGSGGGRGTLWAQLARRFESYKTHVVKPFFRQHFATLDRQIVLIDVLSALNDGRDALAETTAAMQGVLAAFRPGRNTWLSSIFRRRVERIVFAATKADHLGQEGHDRLEALVKEMALDAISRAQFAGADVKVLALSALRATREAEMRTGAERLACVVGTPLAGERIDGRVFDGRTEVAVFPGDLPTDAAAALRTGEGLVGDPVRVLRFAPPQTAGLPADAVLPHIRLDRALDFLLGDRLT